MRQTNTYKTLSKHTHTQARERKGVIIKSSRERCSISSCHDSSGDASVMDRPPCECVGQLTSVKVAAACLICCGGHQ